MTYRFTMSVKSIARTGLFAIVAASTWAVAASAGESHVKIRSYESPAGDTYSSLSLSIPGSDFVADATDHVVLIDTSASQVGEHRTRSFDVMKSFLAALPQTDRVAVVAVDVRTAAMTDGFLSATEASTQALDRLNTRFPAGSSDLQQGLLEAATLLASSGRASILYIGDGMSAAHLLQQDELQHLVNLLRAQEIPVHSYAVGSNMDMRLLGILGSETGGYVVRDEWNAKALTGAQAGQLLAAAAHRPILYPTKIEVSWTGGELLPNRPLPLRSDRETVYLSRGEIVADAKLIMTTSQQPLEWQIVPGQTHDGNTFLAHLWYEGQTSDGLTTGLAADWMVNLAFESFTNTVGLLESQGLMALRAGDVAQAEKIGFQLQAMDPSNARAASLINKAGEAQFTAAQPAEPAPGAIPAPAARPFPEREGPVAAGPIDQFEADRIARGQKLQREVELEVERANALLVNRPDAAQDILERLNGAVKSETNIDAELKNQLLRRVNAAITSFQTRRREIDSAITERNRKTAEKEAQQRLLSYEAERGRDLEQYVERARALMADGYRGNSVAFEESEKVARQAASDFPGSATATAMVFVSEAAQQLDRSERLRLLRSDRFVEVLHQVELSHVPFPDEPPVVYPAPERWQEITELRRKWKSVDLRRNSPNEQKIYEELGNETSIYFPGNPLSDVIEHIRSLHQIPILMDEQVLEDAGVTTDAEVKLEISNVTLRSALKLLLSNVNGVPLTYVVEDEVMKITTVEAADEKLTTRVYPVADLVINIQPLGGGFGTGIGGGGLGGGGGGFGGGQGGFGGGGQGGFGGGGQGGFGGGGGGGFFSIPADRAPLDPGKKKPLN